MTLSFNHMYYVTYFFWHVFCFFLLFLLCQILLLKHIMTLLKHLFYSNILHALCLSILCQLFIWQQIISIIFNCFIPIELIDIIALPLHVALHVALCLQRSSLSLHIAGPSQCPWVDKPHPASVPGTRPAVAGRSRKVSVQEVGNGSGVADWNYRQLSQDTFHWNDVENYQWFLVV